MSEELYIYIANYCIVNKKKFFIFFFYQNLIILRPLFNKKQQQQQRIKIKHVNKFDEQAKNKNKSLLLTTQSQVFIHKYLFIYMKS